MKFCEITSFDFDELINWEKNWKLNILSVFVCIKMLWIKTQENITLIFMSK